MGEGLNLSWRNTWELKNALKQEFGGVVGLSHKTRVNITSAKWKVVSPTCKIKSLLKNSLLHK